MDHVQKHAVLAQKLVQDQNMDLTVVAVNAQDHQTAQHNAVKVAVQVKKKIL